MEEKRQDLTAEKQKRRLEQLLQELSREHMDLYYQSTSEIAFQLKTYIRDGAKLDQEDRALLEPLSQSDIQIRLSLK